MRVKGKEVQAAPVDAVAMREWEAGTASEAGAWIAFWCWYQSVEQVRLQQWLRVMRRILRQWRVLFRYPLYTAHIRSTAAKVLVRK